MFFIKCEMASNYRTPRTRTLMTELKNQFDKLEARMNDKIDSIIKRLENYKSSNPPKQQSTSSKSMALSTTIVRSYPLLFRRYTIKRSNRGKFHKAQLVKRDQKLSHTIMTSSRVKFHKAEIVKMD